MNFHTNHSHLDFQISMHTKNNIYIITLFLFLFYFHLATNSRLPRPGETCPAIRFSFTVSISPADHDKDVTKGDQKNRIALVANLTFRYGMVFISF